MNSYTARCTWDEEVGVWAVVVEEVDGAITQCQNLDQVPGDVAEVLELLCSMRPDEYHLEVVADIGGRPGFTAQTANGLRRLEDLAQRATRTAVAELRSIGLPYRDVAALTGISYQRAQQISTGGVSADEVDETATELEASPIITAARFGATEAVAVEDERYLWSIGS